MGSGKSHWGKRIAELLHWQFIDLDNYIEEQEGLTIADIFNKHGEVHFRELEKKYLQETTGLRKVVIAAGGGTPCFFDNMEAMNRSGKTYYLKTKIATIISRLDKQTNDRPLLKGKSAADLPAFFEKQLKERERFYLQAAHIVEVEKLNDSNLKEMLSLSEIL
jgi:shikimate kinase